ncbi:MAG: DUF2914 domain-containing protein [bacterium]|nr:hypothetical protein [Deltaproteobacteria bacterium]MCP4904634.1 DUF2914 domain-containing protein [bacterium]
MASLAPFESSSLLWIPALGALTGLVLLLGGSGQALAQNAPEDPETIEASTLPSALPNVLAQFTTAVENREPVDQVTFVSNETRKIFLFSDLRRLSGQTVTHRWIYDGKTVAEVPFAVRGPRWRVWSSKELREDWIGDWTVEIVAGDGEVVGAETFTFSAPDA